MRAYFIVLIFIFASIRGFFIINIQLPSDIIYNISSALILLLGIWGFNRRSEFFGNSMVIPKTLVNINFVFGIFFIAGNFLLGGRFNVAFLYTYLVPYVIFLFISIPQEKFKIGFLVIACVTSYSIIINFLEAHYGAGGLQYLLDYQEILRPSDVPVISRTGDFYRIGGYTGSYHDSANLLGMLLTYYFVNFLVSKKKYNLIITVLALVSLLMTQSGSNIVMALLVCFIATFYIYSSNISLLTINMFAAALFFYILNLFNPDILIFTDRIGYDGDWAGMLNMLGLDLLLTPYFWVGFGSSVGSNFMSTEIAYIKLILDMGIFSAVILFFLLIYPVFFFIKKEGGQFQLLPPLAAILFGFLSLAHYGSLFRSTNVLVFYSMYALFFNRVKAGKLRVMRNDA
jgi:hypothetical protein